MVFLTIVSTSSEENSSPPRFQEHDGLGWGEDGVIAQIYYPNPQEPDRFENQMIDVSGVHPVGVCSAQLMFQFFGTYRIFKQVYR